MIQAVFLLGGRGTRLGLVDRPKPMVEFCGAPLLQHMVDGLAAQGVTDFVFLTQHMSHVIEDWFGDGAARGLRIRYLDETEPLGTAGAVRNARHLLADEFVVVYGDVLFDIDLGKFVLQGRRNGGLGTLCVHPNDHPYDSDLVEADAEGLIRAFHGKPHPPGLLVRNKVNAALYYLKREILDFVPETAAVLDWGRDVFPGAVRDGARLYAYNSTEYIKDVGTKDRIARAAGHWTSGTVRAKSYRNPQRAVFIDRDGVLNREIDGVLRPEDMELLPGVGESVARLNASPFLGICVTNQPVLAKGFLGMEGLDRVHARMDQLLGDAGAYLDDLYFCPHHPERGWQGEVAALKIACDCRKPAAGMLRRAAEAHRIDLARSYMIGDRLADIAAGLAAGCRTILVHGNQESPPAPEARERAHHVEPSLAAAVQRILSMEEGSPE